MYALTAARETRIPVFVRAADPLSRAGTIAQLRLTGDVTLCTEEELGGGVALVVAEDIDAETIRVIRDLRRRGVERVVLLAGRVDDKSLLQAVEAGVAGVVRRSEASPRNLVHAIRSVAAGEGLLPPDMLARLLDQVGQMQRQVLAPRGLTFSGLTDREISVLRLLADGKDTAEVGRELFYSERTVKNIVHDVTSRLDLRNRTHAVAYALRQGLI
ncbi:MAG TPA: response regulator transcription factor [Candidatus Limnocylindrales bacterium]|nr:response regulator transcription factor [Candidatus Limnocylindrales bacterium]